MGLDQLEREAELDFIIIISEYDEFLAKRQPWYSVKKLISDLNHKGYSTKVMTQIKNVPADFSGKIIKIFSFKDIYSWRKRDNLIYFMTFPVYEFSKIFTLSPFIVLENFKDLYKILMFSLIPLVVKRSILSRAAMIIVISDRAEKYLSKSLKIYKYIPFMENNWGVKQEEKSIKSKKTLGYFGPPFTTRCFEEVIEFYGWLEEKNIDLRTKIITRIDRSELQNYEEKYSKKLSERKTELISGFLTREELQTHLAEIDIFILPFRIVMSELPIVVLEALELGKCLITTDDGGISSLPLAKNQVLMLERFSSKEYERILRFIRTAMPEDFVNISSTIQKINEKAVDAICQS